MEICAASEAARKALIEDSARHLVLGRIRQFVGSLPNDSKAKEMRQQIANVEQPLAREKECLGPDRTQHDLGLVASQLSRTMTNWARRCGALEGQDEELGIDLVDLIPQQWIRGKRLTMKEVGGESNAVRFHIIAHLALHNWFASNKRPVPHLLLIDQPSQRFYPDRSKLNSDDPDLIKLFEVIFAAVKQAADDLQVILLEQAKPTQPWFRDTIVADWHEGTKLIPDGWPEAEQAGTRITIDQPRPPQDTPAPPPPGSA